MKYPYFLYQHGIRHVPVFNNLSGPPFVFDMSYKNPILSEMDVRDQAAFQQILEKEMGEKYSWGIAAYLERRDSLLGSCPQMVEEKRFYHLGLDVIVPLGTALRAPLDALVQESGYESGEGNYGGFVLLRHESREFETFYSFYGHLCRTSLPKVRSSLRAGEAFAETGDFHENGNWFYHTHIQVITQRGLEEGYISKGYCAASDLKEMDALCPSPLLLFRI